MMVEKDNAGVRCVDARHDDALVSALALATRSRRSRQRVAAAPARMTTQAAVEGKARRSGSRADSGQSRGDRCGDRTEVAKINTACANHRCQPAATA
jgi:hypothetical protein